MGQESEFTFQIPTPMPTDEGADALSVELVAWSGLAAPLPKGGAAGTALLLDQTQGALPVPDARGRELLRAEGVLRQAQQTRRRARSLEAEISGRGGKGCPLDHLYPSGRVQPGPRTKHWMFRGCWLRRELMQRLQSKGCRQQNRPSEAWRPMCRR